MTTAISKTEMEELAGDCDDVKDGVKGTGTTVTGQDKPKLDGFLLAAAIGDVNAHWKKQADHSGSQWKYYGSAMRATAAGITGTDKANAFVLPKVGKDELDIPVPMPFEMFDTKPPAN